MTSKKAINMKKLCLSPYFYAILLELSLDLLVSITTPSLVGIMVFNLLIEVLKEFSCFSSGISRYALTATGKPTFPIRLTKSLISSYNEKITNGID